MKEKRENTVLSPTVLQVIEQFVTAMRGDEAIENESIDRLDRILRKCNVPTPDEINVALFERPQDGQS